MIKQKENYVPFGINAHDIITGQSLYNDMFGINMNWLFYKWTVI